MANDLIEGETFITKIDLAPTLPCTPIVHNWFRFACNALGSLSDHENFVVWFGGGGDEEKRGNTKEEEAEKEKECGRKRWNRGREGRQRN